MNTPRHMALRWVFTAPVALTPSGWPPARKSSAAHRGRTAEPEDLMLKLNRALKPTEALNAEKAST
jgi:hypothetical protein